MPRFKQSFFLLLATVTVVVFTPCIAFAASMNTRDHIAYMEIKDGRFRPDDPLTRCEAARMIFYLLWDQNWSAPEAFTDLGASDCYYEANALASLGIMGGFSGEFRPQSTVSHVELADILKRFYPSGDFVIPLNSEPISRAETASVMNRVLERHADQETAKDGKNIRILLDVPQDHPSFYDICEATIKHQYAKNALGEEFWSEWDAARSNLPAGKYTYNGELYLVNDIGQLVRNDTVDGLRFDKNGRYTTGVESLDAALADIIQKRTTSDMTMYEKRRALYVYVRDSYTYLKRPNVDRGAKGFEYNYASNMINDGRGNCYSYASLHGLLLRKLGYDVNIISGLIGTRRSPHGWVEIISADGSIKIDDPEIDMAERKKGNIRNFFDVTYTAAPFVYVK